MSEMKRLRAALFFSVSGIKAAYREEAAFRTECLLALIMIPLAFILTPVGVERALLIAVVVLVLVVELINSAIEAVVDRISEEQHNLSKKAKDCGSAAVLVALLLAGATWLLILI